MWPTSRNWPRKLAKDWSQWLSSKEFRASDRAAGALRSRCPSKTSCLPPEGSVCDPERLLFGKSPNYEVPEQQSQPRRPGVCVTDRDIGRPGCRRTYSECARERCRCRQHTPRTPAAMQSGRKKTSCALSFFPALAAFTISLWLIPGSMNYNKWLRSCPFWHGKRASLLNAETCHSQENYPKPRKDMNSRWIH